MCTSWGSAAVRLRPQPSRHRARLARKGCPPRAALRPPEAGSACLKSVCVELHSVLSLVYLSANCAHFKNNILKFLFIFRGEGRKRGRETSVCGCLTHPTGMCPDWDSNRQPFGLQARAQSTEPYQPGPIFFLLMHISHTIKLTTLKCTIQHSLECSCGGEAVTTAQLTPDSHPAVSAHAQCSSRSPSPTPGTHHSHRPPSLAQRQAVHSEGL